jgi:hypothetical protein
MTGMSCVLELERIPCSVGDVEKSPTRLSGALKRCSCLPFLEAEVSEPTVLVSSSVPQFGEHSDDALIALSARNLLECVQQGCGTIYREDLLPGPWPFTNTPYVIGTSQSRWSTSRAGALNRLRYRISYRLLHALITGGVSSHMVGLG